MSPQINLVAKPSIGSFEKDLVLWNKKAQKEAELAISQADASDAFHFVECRISTKLIALMAFRTDFVSAPEKCIEVTSIAGIGEGGATALLDWLEEQYPDNDIAVRASRSKDFFLGRNFEHVRYLGKKRFFIRQCLETTRSNLSKHMAKIFAAAGLKDVEV